MTPRRLRMRRDWNPAHHRAVAVDRHRRDWRRKSARSTRGQRETVAGVHKLALRRNFSWKLYRKTREQTI